jgi:hypothetical protein
MPVTIRKQYSMQPPDWAHAVGLGVGSAVGLGVGDAVGPGVGLGVGMDVGLAVGPAAADVVAFSQS